MQNLKYLNNKRFKANVKR